MNDPTKIWAVMCAYWDAHDTAWYYIVMRVATLNQIRKAQREALRGSPTEQFRIYIPAEAYYFTGLDHDGQNIQQFDPQDEDVMESYEMCSGWNHKNAIYWVVSHLGIRLGMESDAMGASKLYHFVLAARGEDSKRVIVPPSEFGSVFCTDELYGHMYGMGTENAPLIEHLLVSEEFNRYAKPL